MYTHFMSQPFKSRRQAHSTIHPFKGIELGAGNIKKSETVSSNEKLPVHWTSQVCDSIFDGSIL